MRWSRLKTSSSTKGLPGDERLGDEKRLGEERNKGTECSELACWPISEAKLGISAFLTCFCFSIDCII